VAQCSEWIKDLIPHATVHYTKATTEAMEIVENLKDPHHVAIGSHNAGPFYNLVPFVDNIANNPHNFTRFIVLSMTPICVPETVEAKTSISFSVQKFVPGSLIAVLEEFSKRKLNLVKLISRPRIEASRDTWEEIFFADIEANLNASAMQDILEDIKPFTNSLKVLGCYASNFQK
ncbi:MAG: prephenate dehydratase domain-containing protein, partial [Succinivibrio sp.]|nr:prephenate dehydratase domain-containing protein [Succinivibrio sp.]